MLILVPGQPTSQILSMLPMALDILQGIKRITGTKTLMTVIPLFSYFILIGSHAP